VIGPPVNLVPSQYRNVSVADVPVSLDEPTMRAYLVGRPAYRRTRYLVARHGGASAVLDVSKESEQPLFSPITAVRLVAAAEETAFVDAPQADTAIPSQLARVAAERAPQARCVIVRGRYGHVSFIADPAPVRVTVVEVVPPRPAKLVDQLTRVLDLAEDLPPVELVPDLVDLAELAATRPSGHYRFPCRAGGARVASLGAAGPGAESLGSAEPAANGPGGGEQAADGPGGGEPAANGPGGGEPGAAGLRAEVSYLDEVPARRPWTLVGCARSRAIHDFFYSGEVDMVDMCPRSLAARRLAGRPGLVVTKCCLLEDRVSAEGNCVVVPWGATFAQVKEGLELALRAYGPAQR
jgi:hypothetical protein